MRLDPVTARRTRLLALSIASCFCIRQAAAQIGAEAQGGKLTLWTALGIDYKLSPHWTSMTDLGYGCHSDPDNTQLFKRQGLNVLTQDFIYHINDHWRVAVSGGYWRRNAYQDAAPYNSRNFPYEFRNELRPYQRLYYKLNIGQVKITNTFRIDERFYFTQDFHDPWTTPFEFRARYMLDGRRPFTKDKQNWVIVNDEVLTAIDQRSSGTWSEYQFTENRFSLYYRHTFTKQRVDIDLGLMHQYWRERPGASNFNISYNIMFDIILHDPFRKQTEEAAQ